MESTEIWTERLFLRAAEEKDLPAFAKWMSDPQSMQYWSCAPHTSIEETKNFLDEMIASPYHGVMDFVVCLPRPRSDSSVGRPGSTTPTPSTSTSTSRSSTPDENYLVIGKAGVWDGKEIGFMFDRDHWGKGYAFEALDAILQHIWALEGDEATKVIKADVDPRNQTSLRLLQKLGFVKVGSAEKTFETHIGWCDSVYLEARNPLDQ